MDRQEADRILAGYDAERYADEIPDELLERLGKARILSGEPLDGQRWHETPLTPAELLVVRWASHGLNNIETSEVTGIPHGTIQTQVKGAMRKLRAKNRTHLVARALREGLID